MIERVKQRTAKIGFFSVAHATYWDQFEGLLDNIMGYHSEAIKLIKTNHVEIVDYGMVDSSEKAFETAVKMQGDRLDVVFCNMITYATSSVFAPIIREVNLPVVLLALQPLSHLDYSKASTFMQLENDNICSVPEFTGVAIRFEKLLMLSSVCYTMIKAEQEISERCDIARSSNPASENRTNGACT